MQRYVHPKYHEAWRPREKSLWAWRRFYWFNALLGNFAWFRSVLSQELRKEDRVLELSAGPGYLGWELLKIVNPPKPKALHSLTSLPFPPRLCGLGGVLSLESVPFFERSSDLPSIEYTGLDAYFPRPLEWPSTWHWRKMDFLDLEDYAEYSVIIANAVLHLLDAKQLRTLGQRWQIGPRLLVFNEPLRNGSYYQLIRSLSSWVSNSPRFQKYEWRVCAGFSGGELPEYLGLDQQDWSLHYDERLLGAYRMIAKRR